MSDAHKPEFLNVPCTPTVQAMFQRGSLRQLEEIAPIGNSLIFILAAAHVPPFGCSLYLRCAGPASKKQLEEIAPIGNSPTFMSMSDARKTMQLWMNISIAIFKDQEASKVGGCVPALFFESYLDAGTRTRQMVAQAPKIIRNVLVTHQ
eukprot:220235-Pelagomonas_calceolata.AAC.4